LGLLEGAKRERSLDKFGLELFKEGGDKFGLNLLDSLKKSENGDKFGTKMGKKTDQFGREIFGEV